MTEQEWLECNDPEPMLEFLRGEASERKFRLFACACCRRIWHLLDHSDRECVEGGETIAEGGSYPPTGSIEYAYSESEAAALSTVKDDAYLAARSAADLVSTGFGIEAAMEGAFADYVPRILAERRSQTSLLRCVMGLLPFRPVTTHPSWLAWNDYTVVKMAQAIYEDRAFGHLPILADALEDAGCDDSDVLDHLRGPGPHVRGCWVVDLLLGKK